jgi:hypothetical protein
MKFWSIVILVSFAAVSLSATDASNVAGSYRSAGGTQVITLALLPNGNYLAHWEVDIFPENGRARGTWVFENGEVRLTPLKEEGALKGHLTVLSFRTMEGCSVLIRKEDVQHADNPFFYFYRKERAQKRGSGSS